VLFYKGLRFINGGFFIYYLPLFTAGQVVARWLATFVSVLDWCGTPSVTDLQPTVSPFFLPNHCFFISCKKIAEMDIKCPHCHQSFKLDDALSDDMKKDNEQKLQEQKNLLRSQMEDFIKKKEAEFTGKAEILEKEKVQIATAAAQKAGEGYAAQLKSLEEERNQKTKQLHEYEKKQLDLLREKASLEEKQKNFEFELEKRFLEKRKELEEATEKKQHQLFDLKINEYKLQMEQQQKLIEELRRKSEQGSMQLQGESQEVLLEEILKENFPFDMIEEVGKGVEGADCIQVVRNHSGTECGRIIYESKRTKTWSNVWVEKLKTDKRNSGADVAILVTQTYPKDMDRFGEREGVWVCNFGEAAGMAAILRTGIIQVHGAQKTQENRGGKMELLYNFLLSNDFRGQMEAIAEGFMAMKMGITKERMQMEKIWKEREKQLEKVLINTSGMYGSIKGIAGTSLGDIPLLDGSDSDEEILD
jgi:hypothetical protein